jgi:hypothetical protein
MLAFFDCLCFSKSSFFVKYTSTDFLSFKAVNLFQVVDIALPQDFVGGLLGAMLVFLLAAWLFGAVNLSSVLPFFVELVILLDFVPCLTCRNMSICFRLFTMLYPKFSLVVFSVPCSAFCSRPGSMATVFQ